MYFAHCGTRKIHTDDSKIIMSDWRHDPLGLTTSDHKEAWTVFLERHKMRVLWGVVGLFAAISLVSLYMSLNQPQVVKVVEQEPEVRSSSSNLPLSHDDRVRKHWQNYYPLKDTRMRVRA